MFLSLPEQSLREAEETLGLSELDYSKTMEIFKPFKCDPFLDDEKLLQILKSLDLPKTDTASVFYSKLREPHQDVSYKQLITAFALCSEWDDDLKSKVLFEAYTEEMLSHQHATEMISTIYSIVMESLPSIVDAEIVNSYLASISEHKDHSIIELHKSLFRVDNQGGTELELSLQAFQKKFEFFKVKFLNSTEARTSFKRFSAVKHGFKLREQAAQPQAEPEVTVDGPLGSAHVAED